MHKVGKHANMKIECMLLMPVQFVMTNRLSCNVSQIHFCFDRCDKPITLHLSACMNISIIQRREILIFKLE